MRISPLCNSIRLNNKNLLFKSLKKDACLIPADSLDNLSKSISEKSGLTPIPTDIHKFANGETYVNIKGNLAGKDAYLLPANTGNPNDDMTETYLRADAAKRMGAKNVIAILPYFPYARQEKRVEDGEPNAARLNMDFLQVAGANKLLVVDIHNTATDGFTSREMPMTNIYSMKAIKERLAEENFDKENLVIVSPDTGGMKRAKVLAKEMDCETAIICKTRKAHNQASAEFLVGDVQGKTCVIYDDMIDTAGTIKEAVKMLKSNGADKVYVCAAHGLFNGNAMKNLSEVPIEKIITTNTIPQKSNALENMEQVDIADAIVGEMKKITP